MFIRVLLIIICSVVPLVGHGEAFVSTRDRAFVDAEGREVLLRGMSVINKNRQARYQPWHGAEDFARMRDWGMNCIRLGISWDAVEPEMGVYDEDFLEKLDGWIALAEAHGLYVFLDMHQDLYGVKFDNGAPLWATLDDGAPHPERAGIWSDGYTLSPAIQRSFDNFWANKPCADGVGVQDHFAKMWQHVAQRYADNSTVIGYDLFNEPNIGSGNLVAQANITVALAKAWKRADPKHALEPVALMEAWLTPEGRSDIMDLMRNMAIYKPMVDGAAEVFVQFEREKMVPMFQRVRDAIREVDKRHIFFLETSMSANMGIPTGVEVVVDGQGKPDPLQAFAPHAYDIVVDTPDRDNPSLERLDLIFDRHGATGKRMKVPVLIGEWGAYGRISDAILPGARHVVGLMERHLMSDTYWEYGRYVTDPDCVYREVLQRPYPQRVAGKLRGYSTDFETQTFECHWKEDAEISAPTHVYVPHHFHPEQRTIRVTPGDSSYQVEAVGDEAGGVVFHIPGVGKNVKRSFYLE